MITFAMYGQVFKIIFDLTDFFVSILSREDTAYIQLADFGLSITSSVFVWIVVEVDIIFNLTQNNEPQMLLFLTFWTFWQVLLDF